MPIYEYRCTACQREFEAIVHGSQRAACPDCGGRKLDKRLSVFAVGPSSAPAAPRGAAGPCGSCGDPRGPGSCRLD